jgi:hypothetical protein
MFRINQIFKQQIRTLYKKPRQPPGLYTKNGVDAQVYEVLYDYANVPDEKVSLNDDRSRCTLISQWIF